MPRQKKARAKTRKKEVDKRPSWDDYFLNLVEAVASRSTCDRGKPGCVITKDKRIMVTGYAGSPMGLPHCDDVGHEMRKMIDERGNISEHCVRTIHAEQNAICQAARFGISLDGGVLYCSMEPCYNCAKMIINAGIKEVICKNKYHTAKDTRRIFRQARVKLKVIEKKDRDYSK